ncbi:MAG: mechanosensitive ion channel [Ignavibacteria bacterium]|nr:mechanosensitive ion channel [Ignavibacteria bacterium]MBT8390966.1 mechanosensitive ion channel [Ignavibacteria bacterium]NNJ52704.1 mechanosensitive ion channel [Ignavibacteriaceae bacterium]NNL21561.1 mechanosensitive ion channel [Ignavibacteriaceae bacterium]
MEELNTNQVQNYSQKAIDLVIEYAPDLILAIIVLVVGLFIIKLIVKATNRAMERSEVDISLRKFLSRLFGILLKVLLLISVASMVGIATTSFVAILGAAGLAVGLALQGGLANFAGGVIILIFKPFKVGDFIDAQSHAGTVSEITIFTTFLKTPDNKTVIIPNGALSNGSMVNFSTEPRRRVDMDFGIGYNDDIKKAKDVLKSMVDSDTRVLKDPAPQIVVGELADSSVNFKVRAWCEASDYWGIYFDMQEKVKQNFDKEGISIPFPQRDVHVYNQ